MSEAANVLGALLVLLALVPALTLGVIELCEEAARAMDDDTEEKLHFLLVILPALPAALVVVAWIIW
jgi:hypothetical protein